MGRKLNIGDALSYGFDRITTRGGVVLLAAYILVQLVAQVSAQSLFTHLLSELLSDEQLSQTYPLAIDLPVTVSTGLLGLLTIAGTVLSVITIRALYSDIDSVPTADHTRRLGRTVGVLLVVSVVTSLATLIGSVFFLLPGIFLAVSLVFGHIAVAIEDAGVIEALRRSWELTSGNRIQLILLGLVVGAGAAVIGGIFGIVGVFAPVIGGLLSALVIAVVSLFSIAVLVGAYKQLAGDVENDTAASW